MERGWEGGRGDDDDWADDDWADDGWADDGWADGDEQEDGWGWDTNNDDGEDGTRAEEEDEEDGDDEGDEEDEDDEDAGSPPSRLPLRTMTSFDKDDEEEGETASRMTWSKFMVLEISMILATNVLIEFPTGESQ